LHITELIDKDYREYLANRRANDNNLDGQSAIQLSRESAMKVRKRLITDGLLACGLVTDRESPLLRIYTKRLSTPRDEGTTDKENGCAVWHRCLGDAVLAAWLCETGLSQLGQGYNEIASGSTSH
jgi:hypothetical protein